MSFVGDDMQFRIIGNRLTLGAAAICGMLFAGSAEAAISVSVTNTYGYFFDTGTPSQTKGGEREQVFQTYRYSGYNSSLGVDLVGRADANSFFFLHNNYCVGICTTGSSTVIDFLITNESDEAISLRFDSQITPGHLARIGSSDAQANASFDFNVTQTNANGTTFLYSAFGTANGEGLQVFARDGRPFNDENAFDNGQGGEVLDWSATSLNLDLVPIGAGETSLLRYSATYEATSSAACDDLSFGCSGVQVVFGDPRNNGAGTQAFARFAASAEPLRDIINREYTPYVIPFAIVPAGSDLPPAPDLEDHFDYGADFTPPDVPEPATWASMIAGLGMIGGALRRRRAGGGAVAA